MKDVKKTQLSITVPEDLVEFMDQEIKNSTYSSRSHAIAKALQELKDRTGKRP
jgi:Arc/MetJ-type ribon-helix-helix transcriptional regulator